MTLPSEESGQDTPSGSADRLERRRRLRQFQSDLVERMQAAREQAGARDNQLGVLIGEKRWLLDLQETGEVVPVTPITKVPLTHDWYLGLLNIRGNLVSVIDFARYQGGAPTEITPSCRIVTFAPALGINCGLLVSRIYGLRNVIEMQLLSPTEDPATDSEKRMRDTDGQEWTSLSLTAIAQDQRFLHIGV